MKFKNLNIDDDFEVLESREMYIMSQQDYTNYVKKDGIVLIDHHDTVRDSLTGRSLATTRQQLNILIELLISFRDRMRDKEDS